MRGVFCRAGLEGALGTRPGTANVRSRKCKQTQQPRASWTASSGAQEHQDVARTSGQLCIGGILGRRVLGPCLRPVSRYTGGTAGILVPCGPGEHFSALFIVTPGAHVSGSGVQNSASLALLAPTERSSDQRGQSSTQSTRPLVLLCRAACSEQTSTLACHQSLLHLPPAVLCLSM